MFTISNVCSPRDMYTIKMWDENYVRPSYCEVGDGLPYCQIFGNMIYDLPSMGYNTADPAAHMMEQCPSTPTRPDFC